MVAPVIAAIMMRWMFNDQFGIVNAVLEGCGLEGQPWLVERWSAFGIIVLTDIWLWTPWFTLLLLAGLQSLPKEPFEAAAIDGTVDLARVPPPDAADAAAGDRGLRGDPRHRRLPHLRHRVDADRRRARPLDRAVQPLRLRAAPSSISTSAAARRRRSSAASSSWWSAWCCTASSTASPRPETMAMVRHAADVRRACRHGGRRALFALALFGICFAFAFPVLWLILTSLRPESGVYYVHRGTEFTLGELRRGADRRAAGRGLRQFGADLDAGHRLLAAGDGVERLHAVALPRARRAAPGSAPSTCSAACPTSRGCCRSTS